MSAVKSFAGHSLWSVGFRPFFLIGALYGPFILFFWLLVYAGLPLSLPQSFGSLLHWHQHEMIFGYAMAVIVGFLLTAVPSWVGGEELKGRWLQLLVLSWLLGRLLIWLPLPIEWWWKMLGDQLLLLLLAVHFLPQVWRASNRRYRWLLALLLVFMAGNGLYHYAAAVADQQLLQQAMLISVYGLMFFYSVIGGVLTTVFTGNVLRQCGDPEQLKLLPRLEYLCAFSLVLLAVADLLSAPSVLLALVAGLALACHAVRFWRWQPMRVWRFPLVVVLHMSYAWLLVTLLLKAVAGLGWLEAANAWVHAFTIGVLGLKQLGLMTRVSLRHTGRALLPHWLMGLAFFSMFVAASLRVAASILNLSVSWLLLSAVFWGAAFLLYVAIHAGFLWRPRLGKQQSQSLAPGNSFWLLEQGQRGG